MTTRVRPRCHLPCCVTARGVGVESSRQRILVPFTTHSGVRGDPPLFDEHALARRAVIGEASAPDRIQVVAALVSKTSGGCSSTERVVRG